MKLEKISFQVTIINPVAASIGELLRSKIPVWLHLGVDLFLKGEKEKLFVTHTVGNILFNGFQDPLLNAMTDLKAILKEFVPDGAFMDKFAFFYARWELTYQSENGPVDPDRAKCLIDGRMNKTGSLFFIYNNFNFPSHFSSILNL